MVALAPSYPWPYETTATNWDTGDHTVVLRVSSTGSNLVRLPETREQQRERLRQEAFQASQEALQEARTLLHGARPIPGPKALYRRPRTKGRTCSGASRYRTLVC